MRQVAVFGFVALVLVAGALAIFENVAESKSQAEALADGYKAKADHFRAVAEASDAAIALREQRIESQWDELESRSARIDELRAKLESAKRSRAAGSAGTVVIPPDLSLVVEQQGALIEAQDAALDKAREIITTQDEQIKGLTISRDAWKCSALQRDQEALQLRAALEARKGIEKGLLLKGRVQGFAVGFAAGGIGGALWTR